MPQTGLLKLDLHLPANREKLRFAPFETGTKSLAFAVSFREPFPTPPTVLCAIAGFQSTPADTFHLLVHPRDITTTGFRILLTAQHDNTVSTVTVPGSPSKPRPLLQPSPQPPTPCNNQRTRETPRRTKRLEDVVRSFPRTSQCDL